MAALSGKSPENEDYKRNLAIYKTEKARAQLALEQSDEALVSLNEAQEMLEPIIKANHESATYQEDLAMAYRLTLANRITFPVPIIMEMRRSIRPRL